MERKYVIFETIYLLPTLIFHFALKKLNAILLSKSFDSSFSLLAYDPYKPVWFFFGALGFVIWGVVLGFYFYQQIKHEYLEYKAILFLIVSIILIILVIIKTFILINNPILKAVLGVVAIITAVSSSDGD